MAKRGLGGKRSELEEKYFGERDQKLLTAMREEAAQKAKKAAIMDATGIADEELVEQLHELDMCHETVAALTMMKLSDVMLVEMSDVVFAKMADVALSEMMTPAMFEMAAVAQPVFKVAPG